LALYIAPVVHLLDQVLVARVRDLPLAVAALEFVVIEGQPQVAVVGLAVVDR
jgi:hypothetical protein